MTLSSIELFALWHKQASLSTVSYRVPDFACHSRCVRECVKNFGILLICVVSLKHATWWWVSSRKWPSGSNGFRPSRGPPCSVGCVRSSGAGWCPGTPCPLGSKPKWPGARRRPGGAEGHWRWRPHWRRDSSRCVLWRNAFLLPFYHFSVDKPGTKKKTVNSE